MGTIFLFFGVLLVELLVLRVSGSMPPNDMQAGSCNSLEPCQQNGSSLEAVARDDDASTSPSVSLARERETLAALETSSTPATANVKQSPARPNVAQANAKQAPTNPNGVVGVALLAVSVGGLVSYVALRCTPPAVASCFLLACAGLLLLRQGIRADEPLPGLNMSIVDVVAAMLNNYREVWARIFLVMSLPGAISGRDIILFVRQYADESSHAERIANAQRQAALSQQSITTTDGGYHEAVQWLRRPCLELGISAQLRLRGLYLQATLGDAADASDTSRACTTGPVGDALLNYWRAFHALPRAAARAALPVALADADPIFARAHPEVCDDACFAQGGFVSTPTRPAPPSLSQVALQVFERRLPGPEFERMVRSFSAGASAGFSAVALIMFRVARAAAQRSPPRAPRDAGRWILVRSLPFAGGALSAACALYFLTLARGLPLVVHLLFLQLWCHFRRIATGGSFVVSTFMVSFPTAHFALKRRTVDRT